MSEETKNKAHYNWTDFILYDICLPVPEFVENAKYEDGNESCFLNGYSNAISRKQ